MASLIACAEAGFEPIPGYVLRQKLGAGGYGEVWLADAPGGLKKAIKMIFGSLDDSRANSELKALHRIRQVTHPFLLSLERIEIVDRQLIIVTELADGSLCDRFKKCRDNGFRGIPRDQLLDYMRDTADALDFLCQKHDLQHLDVKPANMLLVADRVKVADFGLVKDIQNNAMSMLGGMTPTYAAPEMFDGRPGRFSDQYSLAIMYQELLTGTLPFGGKTTAQLASEHLHRAPNLDPVPPCDRPVLAKALAKKPNQRYSSCREFVEQLIAAGQNSSSDERSGNPVDSNSPRARQPQANLREPEAAKDSSVDMGKTAEVLFRSSTQGFEKREVLALPTIDFVRPETTTQAPTMFVGIGGTGAQILTSLRSEMNLNRIDYEQSSELTWLLLDTDHNSIQNACDEQTLGRLYSESTLHLQLKPAQYYRECDESTFSAISRRWLYNVPRSRTTEGVRPLAMLALLDHTEELFKAIQNYVDHLVRCLEQHPVEKRQKVRIYLLASAHGGTGSGLVSEVGFLIRRVLEERGVDHRIQAILTVGEHNDRTCSDLQSASAVACLSEISHYIKSGGLHPGLPKLPPSQGVSKAPVDDVYLVYGGSLGDRTAWNTAIDQVVEYLIADACTSIGLALDGCRANSHKEGEVESEIAWTPWLRTLCSRRIDLSSRLNPEYVAKFASFQVAQRWMIRLRTNQIDLFDDGVKEQGSPQAIAQRKKTIEQIDCMISDLFREYRWTAQAWLNRCMEMLLQDDYVPIEPDDQAPALEPLRWIDEEIEIEIDRISERLGVDIDFCRHGANVMLDSTIQEFRSWVDHRWMNTKAAWTYLNTMQAMVARRFMEQGTSLRNVSQRLREEHDRILEKVHESNGEANGVVSEKVLSDLDRLEMQARLHEIGGRLLLRLGEYFQSIVDLWRVEAGVLLRSFSEFCVPIAEQLDVHLSPLGILRDAMLPLSQEWEPVRTQIDQDLEERITHWMLSVFRSSAEVPSFAIDLEDSQKEIGENLSQGTTATTTSVQIESRVRVELLKGILPDAIQQACSLSENLNLTWVAESIVASNERPSNQSRSVANHVRESTPPLLEWGGAKRNFMLIPASCGEDADTKWKSLFVEPINIQKGALLRYPLVLCEGEQLILPELMSRLWLMTQDGSGIVGRIYSRSDIDWLPVME